MLTIAVIISLYILIGLGYAVLNLELISSNPGPRYPNSFLTMLIWPAYFHILKKRLHEYQTTR